MTNFNSNKLTLNIFDHQLSALPVDVEHFNLGDFSLSLDPRRISIYKNENPELKKNNLDIIIGQSSLPHAASQYKLFLGNVIRLATEGSVLRIDKENGHLNLDLDDLPQIDHVLKLLPGTNRIAYDPVGGLVQYNKFIRF